MKEKEGFNIKMGISTHYANLDRKTRKVLRDRFLEETGISHPGFYSKLRRNCWSKLEIQAFNHILEEIV